MQSYFFFELFPNCKRGKSDDDQDELDKRFNPFRHIGNLCSHFGFSYKEAMNEISFQNGLMLSLSVPKLKTEKEKEEKEKSNDLFTILEKVDK